eukprot:scaffold27238_cov31-Tisochrysis_lutea.AAC.1
METWKPYTRAHHLARLRCALPIGRQSPSKQSVDVCTSRVPRCGGVLPDLSPRLSTSNDQGQHKDGGRSRQKRQVLFPRWHVKSPAFSPACVYDGLYYVAL